MNNSSTFSADRRDALDLYRGHGLSPIKLCAHAGAAHSHNGRPCEGRSKGKIPIETDWTRHAEAPVDDARMAALTDHLGNFGIPIPPDLVALDADTQSDALKLQELLTRLGLKFWHQKTANGAHLVLRQNPPGKIRNTVKTEVAGVRFDVRGTGGQIAAWPSTHNTGVKYEWQIAPWDLPREALSEIPADFLPEQAKSIPAKSAGDERLAEGGRNGSLTSLAGSMRRRGMSEQAIAAALAVENARRCDPPLSKEEILGIARSVGRYSPEEAEKSQSMASQLVEIGLECRLFHDEFEQPFVQFKVGDHQEHWPCESKQFKRWLSREFWQREKAAVGSDAIAAALNIISAKACFEGRQVELSNRVARHDGAIFYDLTDDKWRAVKITAAGWEIISVLPIIIFRRYSHQQRQLTPARGGNVKEVLKYVNLIDEDQQILFLVYLIASLIPDVPHPIPIPHGEQGAAKTTSFRVMRRLIDPSATEVLSFPSDKQELAQQLSHHWAPYYDNVSRLSPEQSDSLCRAATGEGFTKRQLFSDDDDVIFKYRRCVGLNGINVVATAGDLLDRTILFGLERIPPEKRMAEEVFWKTFEEARPLIFGGMLDTLAAAMAVLPNVHLTTLFRMADFTRWGSAIAIALGYPSERFISAYERNIKSHTHEAINCNPVAACVVAFMEGKAAWSGTPSELLNQIELVAEGLRLSGKWESPSPSPEERIERSS